MIYVHMLINDKKMAFFCRSVASQKINIWCHLLKSVDSLSNSSRDYRKVYSGIVVRKKKIFS